MAIRKQKEQYDALEKAITAIQATNVQFDKDVIVDGEIDIPQLLKQEKHFLQQQQELVQ